MELLAVLALGLAIAAFVRSNGDRQQIRHLEQAFKNLLREVQALGSKPSPLPTDEMRPAEVTTTSQPIDFLPLPETPPAPPPREEPAAVAPPTAVASPPPKSQSIEEALTSRWLVWVGALAIALSGTFLVRYAIENGLLGPGARVTLGLLLGVFLIAGGEWLRRRPLERAIATIRNDHVPPALTASGLFIAFGSLYAAYALYHLLPPVIAFVALALIALVGVGLSLLQGRFVAMMGLLGAFVTPALIDSSDPSAWTLFFYLLVVEFACLAVARYQSWWWLALSTLAGAVVWPLLWMIDSHWSATDGLPLGLFLLMTALGFFATRRGAPEPVGQEGWAKEVQNLAMPEWVVWIAAVAVAGVQFIVVDWSDYSGASLIFAGVLSALYIVMGRRSPVFDSLPVVAALLALGICATMPGPSDVVDALLRSKPNVFALQYFETSLVGFGALFGVSGFVVLWGAKRPGLWAAVSGAMPVLLLIIAYYRLEEFRVDVSWAVLALVLAALSAVAADRIERYRVARGLENALAFYAAAVVALVSLAAAMVVREAWLTVALSIQLPALAWINTRIRARSLQVIAAIVGVDVLVRLVFNYNVLGYPLAPDLASNWIVYGYGVPALAFYGAARLFGPTGEQRLIGLLEAGSLAFGVLLVSLEIRLFVAHSLSAPHYGLLEQSLHSIAWASIGTALAVWTRRRADNPVLFFGALVLLGAAAAQVVLLQLWVSNPLWNAENIGTYPVINVLFLAYAVPAFFAFRVVPALGQKRFVNLQHFAGGLGFVLTFVYISLETTRAFEGPVFHFDHHSDGELYAYSIVWLAYALALLTLGIVLAKSALRYASLAVLVVTVLKVFLFDMAGLTGLYRVGSFLGLGLSLIGIGYIYQRFVFPRPRAALKD
jgi:uncharacterized membrane protein